jgi:peptidyl-Asp metalloendopeptidase
MRFSPIKTVLASFSIAFASLVCPAWADASRVVIEQTAIDNGSDLLLAAPEKSASVTDAQPTSREVVRSRAVTLDISLMQKLRAEVEAGRAQKLRIGFFNDAQLQLQITRTERFGRNGTAYFGTVQGEAFSSAVIVEENGVVSGNISVGKLKYQIKYAGAIGHVVQQVDASASPPDHPPTTAPREPAAERALRTSTKATAPPEAARALLDDGSQIDVMVVYTPSARISEGGTAGMQSRINLIVAETNNIYLNSGVTQRIRLVYAGEVNFVETNLQPDLVRLQNPADSVMAVVHSLRNLYGADLVSLWGNYTGGCGESNIMTIENTSFASQAFTVVDRNCAANNFSFAHELGHNMGLLHDLFDGNSPTTVTPEGSTTPTLIDYPHGYVDMANQFRSVMAISKQCDMQVPVVSCPRIPYFSNPGLSFNGAPIGNIATAQEFKALNDTRDTTANFRAAVNLNGPGNIVFFPATYAVSENAGTVTLSVTRHAGSTGAVSVHYATFNGSAVAGQDYTATGGTLNWANGESGTQIITISILQNNASANSTSFSVSLDTPTGNATLGAPGFSTIATVNISNFELTGPPLIVSAPPANGFLNIPYTHTFVATGAAPISYSLQGSLPPGLALSSNGIISGTPTVLGGPGPVFVRAINSFTSFERQLVNITITALPPSAPTISSAIAGDARASITFLPSISRGSALSTEPITYTATCEPDAHTASGLTSPIDVTGLTNGTTYTCGVKATTQYGTADSGTLLVTPILNAPPALVTVKSRKLHGTAGAQFLTLNTNVPIGGAITIEPRGSGSAGHTLVFIFNRAITSVGTVTAKDANDVDIGNVSATPVGNSVEVTLLGVPDSKRVTVSVTGVNGTTTVFPVALGFFVGDVNGNHAVNASDISAVKAQLNQTVTDANFRFDLNASGSIDAADMSAVKARSGLVLP